jgi:GntR family transcriptional repressor for pyruvate dehydrogenase complex
MRVLIADIVGGALAPGAQLPRETDLAAQFGVSRGVARECVRGLEERGLVSVKHGRGATVNGDGDWDVFDPDILGALLESAQGAAILGEYLECRRILEIEAVGLAAERASDRDLAALSDAFARMTAGAERARGNPAAEDLYHQADIAFHRAVIAATGNRALGNMTEPIHRALAAARRPLARPEHRLQRSLPEHRRILAAIAAGDAGEARLAMEAHLVTVEGYLREFAETVASRDAVEAEVVAGRDGVEAERHGRP